MRTSRFKINLEGRVVAITGASSGIGKETARELCRRGARVIMLCRSMDKARKAADDILGSGRHRPMGSLALECLDLASLDSVRACAERLLRREDKLDYLVNNAGVMFCPNWKTKDGFDLQFGTNHLGHFLLTELLRPLLDRSAKQGDGFRPRIVIVSSSAHSLFDMHWEDLNWKRSYDMYAAYAQSKLANVLHCKELARRLRHSGISVYSVHPGAVDTDLLRHFEKKWYGRVIAPLARLFLRSPAEGARTTLFCCLDPSVASHTGRYYAKCKEEEPHRRAKSRAAQRRLWRKSEELVGLNSAEGKEEVAEVKEGDG